MNPAILDPLDTYTAQRLGMLSGQGKQELFVYAISRQTGVR